MRLRVTMTIDAPLHGQRNLLGNCCHLVNAAVTRLATHALAHVHRVGEVHEARKLSDTPPVDR